MTSPEEIFYIKEFPDLVMLVGVTLPSCLFSEWYYGSGLSLFAIVMDTVNYKVC